MSKLATGQAFDKTESDTHLLQTVGATHSVDEKIQQWVAQIESLRNQTGRTFNGNLGEAVKSMNQMGCWCYFGEDHGKGKGPPLDELDEICKTLADGYDCAMIDYITDQENGVRRATNYDECIPWEVEYKSALGGHLNQLVDQCYKINKDLCAARACIVEGHFVSTLTFYFISGGAVKLENKHANGFDPKEMCLGKVGNGESEKSCCGEYPKRFPFKTMEGERGCCGTRTYNTFALECCDSEDSSVKSSC